MTVRRSFLISFILMISTVLVVGQDPKQALNDQLYEAVRRGDTPAVTSLLDKGADVNAKFRYGATALFKAAERGHTEIVKILLARGADVNVKDTFYGATAMTWALGNEHYDIVQQLLDKDPSGVEEILINGVAGSKKELVNIALSKGGISKEALTTALYLALHNKEAAEFVEPLKKAGAVPPPDLDAATLQSYVGKYKNDKVEVTITLNEGSLGAAVTGQRAFGVLPTDTTTFRAVFVPGVTLRFKVADGKVAGLSLTRGQDIAELTRVN
jgi:ankyrin repeat protein